MRCSHCQSENLDSAKFCKRCGNPLQPEAVCPHCSHKNIFPEKFCEQCGQSLTSTPSNMATESFIPEAISKKTPPAPAAFASGRYVVKKFLGEGGRKKVYLAHDTVLDREVAFAHIKTEKLDEDSKLRLKREAQAMGRLGDHPNIVTVYDFGSEGNQPYMVLPLLAGGDVEELITKAPGRRIPLDQAIRITKDICSGLSFAHSKGITHRDLKPGNVWLSEDGTAKIGDFGLAMSVDLPRLTQSGVIMGTLAYLPPEQAMGAKVTPMVDLYSLGAMLYEMVAGQRPFVGEDALAIIGQHINTPPVSPSWHREDLPPGLEALIMQLLEKDPQKRPESAAAVYRALESIEAGKVSEGVSENTGSSGENPLYRRVFVGREAELRQLQSAFDGAMSGQGTLMMVVGEPGIGKTALSEQISTYVRLRGGKSLVGHCYEEGSLSLPYLAFVEALRSYVLSRENMELEKELGTGASDVARIVSEVRERMKIELRPQADPEEERYRLLQAVTAFLANASNAQPLLLVLEDLHDADKGTLDMLIHISRHLKGMRLLIVGTYRDVEVDRTHPLSAALAELRRMSSYGRVLLRGLNADEVQRMLENIAREEIPWGLAEAVHRQTEGNPLFVQEVVRYLTEEGLVKQKEGRWETTRETPLEMTIPEGLRDVIGRRLSMLSPECNQMLSVASVIGREFSLDTLRGVAGIDEDVFVNSLKEAVQMSVLEERSQLGSIRYRFTHAFFRQTMYEELIAPLRLKLHQQVARSLEKQYAKRIEEHASELAEHFSQSTDPTDLAKAVSYGEMAAKRAVSVYAYGEAVRLLEQALKVQKVLDPDDKAKVCDLLIALGDNLALTGEMQRAFSVELEEAFLLAEEIGDRDRAARACSVAMPSVAMNGAGSPVSWVTPGAADWVDRADRYAKPDTPDRIWANIGIGELKNQTGIHSGRFDVSREGCLLLIQNYDLARRIADPESLWHAAISRLAQVSAPQRMPERRNLVEELLLKSRAGLSARINGFVCMGFVQFFLEAGQRQRAEEFVHQLNETAERSGLIIWQFLSMAYDAILAGMDGNLEQAVAIGEEIRTRGEQLGLTKAAFMISAAVSLMNLTHLGRFDEIEQFGNNKIASSDALIRLSTSKDQVVAKILDQFVTDRSNIEANDDETPAYIDGVALWAAVRVQHRPASALLLRRFSGTPVATTGIFPICIPRHLGAAAALLGRPEEARKYCDEAIKVTTDMPFRPELALTRLQLAELLLEHYPKEKDAAKEHLDIAIEAFREMKMQPSLDRALKVHSE